MHSPGILHFGGKFIDDRTGHCEFMCHAEALILSILPPCDLVITFPFWREWSQVATLGRVEGFSFLQELHLSVIVVFGRF